MITQARLKELLHYDPDTGVFTWLPRKPSDFTSNGTRSAEGSCRIWNAKFVGKVAGSQNGRGYRDIEIDYHSYRANRLAWLYQTGEFPTELIDHINGARMDDRWCNLRAATNQQNIRNAAAYKTNTAGLKGAHKVITRRGEVRWRATITIAGERINLGRFATAEEAHAAYCSAAREMFGPFARAS
jgi:hypothetical protein